MKFRNESIEVSVAAGLGLAGIEYTPDYYYDYVDSETRQQARRDLGVLALQAARTGKLSSHLGLEYIESDMFVDDLGKHPDEKIAYHGSPHDLNIIRPRQATWHAKDSTQSYRFADGRPAICASPATKFPAMRALLHEAHPEVVTQSLHLRKSCDHFGRPSWFTSEETLASIVAAGTTGYVYAIAVINLDRHADTSGPLYDAERQEYRIYGQRTSLAKVPIGVDTLPSDLCVIPADAQTELASTHLYKNVLQWGESVGVPVRPLGNLWPKDYAD